MDVRVHNASTLAPARARPRPRGGLRGQSGKSSYFTVHCEPNNVFALVKSDTRFLVAFKYEADARAVAASVENHVVCLESWPEMKLRDGVFWLYGGRRIRASTLQFLSVRKWERRDDLLCFAAAASLHLGITSFVREHTRDAYLIPFDAVPINAPPEFYSRVFEGLYDEW